MLLDILTIMQGMKFFPSPLQMPAMEAPEIPGRWWVCTCFETVGRARATTSLGEVSESGHPETHRRWCHCLERAQAGGEGEARGGGVQAGTRESDTCNFTRASNAVCTCPGRAWAWIRERASAFMSSIRAWRTEMAENRARARRARAENRARAERARARAQRITRMKKAKDKLYRADDVRKK